MTAKYSPPESPSTGREDKVFRQQATKMAPHTAAFEWLLTSPGQV